MDRVKNIVTFVRRKNQSILFLLALTILTLPFFFQEQPQSEWNEVGIITFPSRGTSFAVRTNEAVDADSDVDSSANIGTANATYTDAQSVNGQYQGISEFDTGVYLWNDVDSNTSTVYELGEVGLEEDFQYAQGSATDSQYMNISEINAGTDPYDDVADVDSNTSDVDSSADCGTETNFANAQGTTLDSNYMNIQECDNGTPELDEENDVDNNSSDVDSSADCGTETDFTNATGSTLDGNYMNIQECNTGTPESADSGTPITIYAYNNTNGTDIASLSFRVDSNTGDNRLFVVAVAYLDDNSETATVTYNGDATTEYLTAEMGGDDSRVYIFYRKNPDSGSQLEVVVTFSATLISGATTWAGVLNEVDLVDTFGANNTYAQDPSPCPPCEVSWNLDTQTNDVAIGVINGESTITTWSWGGDLIEVNSYLDPSYGDAGSVIIGNETGASYSFLWDMPTDSGTLHTAAAGGIIQPANRGSGYPHYVNNVTDTQSPSDVGLYSNWENMKDLVNLNNLTEGLSGGSTGTVVLESWDTVEDLLTTSITGNRPTGTSDGDLLIVFVNTDGVGAGLAICSSCGATWNVLEAEIQANGVTAASWYKIAASEPTTYASTWSGTEDAVITVLRFTGFDSSDPIDVSDSNTGTGQTVFPTVTTTRDNTFILRYAGMDDDDDLEPIDGTPSAHTRLVGAATTSSSGETTQMIANTTKTTQGSTGTATWAHTSSEGWASWTVAIQPSLTGGNRTFEREFNFVSLNTSSFDITRLAIKTGTVTNETLMVFIYNTTASAWEFLANITDSDDDTWINTSIAAYWGESGYAFRFNSSLWLDDSYQNYWEINATFIDAYNIGDNFEINFEYQWTTAEYSNTTETIAINVQSGAVAENLTIYYWTGSAWTSLGTISSLGWTNVTATGLTSATYTIMINGTVETSDSTQDTWSVDLILLHTNDPAAPLYNIDFEYQWTIPISGDDYNDLEFYLANFPATENLSVYWWGGSSWIYLDDITGNGWNNITAVWASTLTIRIIGTNESVDNTQDSWDFDIMLHHAHTDGSLQYDVGFEYQWTTAEYNNYTAELAINVPSVPAEEYIRVWWVESGGSLVRIGNLDQTGWNNFTVTGNVTSATFTIYFDGSDPGLDSTWNYFLVDLITLYTHDDNYQLDWEHQSQSVPQGGDNAYQLTIYGSATENMDVYMWNTTASAWLSPNVTTITSTLQWYNTSISGVGITTATITWAYNDTDKFNETSQDTLSIDYAGVFVYSLSVNITNTTIAVSALPDASDTGFDENPIVIETDAGEDFDLDIRAVDVTGTPIASNWLWFDNDADPSGYTQLTSSYQSLYTSQSFSTTALELWIWANIPDGITVGARTFTLYVRISKS